MGSLFDGIGVFPLAGSFYGIRAVWASEIEKAAVSITKRHFPEMRHVGDITRLNGKRLPPVDIITFGSPCQNLSTIGNRHGLAGESSGLFYEAIRIIDEMREATNGRHPTFAIWENVAGAFSSNHGLDFAAVLAAFARREIPMPDTGKWTSAGMVCGAGAQIAWRVLDSQHFRIAQRRRRIFLVADLTGERAAKILFNPAHIDEAIKYGDESGLPFSPKNRSHAGKTRGNPPQVYTLLPRKMRAAVQYKDPRAFLSAIGGPARPSPTLLAGEQQIIAVHYPDGPEGDHIRRITPLEGERLMGLPDDWTKYGEDGQPVSDSARYRTLGNSIVLPCAKYIFASMKEILNQEKENAYCSNPLKH